MVEGILVLTNEVDNGHEPDVLPNRGLHNILWEGVGRVAVGRAWNFPIPIHKGPTLRLQIAVPIHGHKRVGEASREC